YTDGVDGFDEPGGGLTQLCPDVPNPITERARGCDTVGGIDHQVPWWAPAGQDTDGTNLYTVECRRGVRVHYGPWQVGTDPATASSTDQCGTNGNPPPPGSYQSGAETCPGSDPRFHCSVYSGYNQRFRNATQYPGRLFVDLPTGRAVYNLEDQLWACDHHVVSELPIGYQGNTTFRNFRKQQGGLIAQHAEDGWPAPGTTPIGGTVGEMIIQLFT